MRIESLRENLRESSGSHFRQFLSRPVNRRTTKLSGLISSDFGNKNLLLEGEVCMAANQNTTDWAKFERCQAWGILSFDNDLQLNREWWKSIRLFKMLLAFKERYRYLKKNICWVSSTAVHRYQTYICCLAPQWMWNFQILNFELSKAHLSVEKFLLAEPSSGCLPGDPVWPWLQVLTFTSLQKVRGTRSDQPSVKREVISDDEWGEE